eukprot:1144725-Pelagomonas_calceolata.AAC.1
MPHSCKPCPCLHEVASFGNKCNRSCEPSNQYTFMSPYEQACQWQPYILFYAVFITEARIGGGDEFRVGIRYHASSRQGGIKQ